MISPNNPDLDVDALMDRVRAEVAAMRALSATHETARSLLGEERRLPAVVVDLSRHAVVTELVEDAARMSKPRTAVPRRLERPPFSLLRPVIRFGLRVLNYTQKDQRHVNAATQQAMREMLRLSVAIGNHVATLSAQLQEGRNAARDLASLTARVTATEQREAAFIERLGELDDTVLTRLGALETLVGAASSRLERLEPQPLTERIAALENAMTVNAGRIDTLEAGPLPSRVGALEEAITLNAGRIDALETKPVDARLLGLEAANTIAAQRLERLESFRELAGFESARIDETRRELSAERERALRSESSLRSELTAQLNAANALVARAPAAPLESRSMTPTSNERYDSLHLAIADRFRGDSDSIRLTFERYLSIVREAGTVDDSHPLADIGSGRGEWLEALSEARFPAFGIDLNATLVARAREEGLDVRLGEAVTVLRGLDAASVGVVTIFHVIEHLAFEEMVALFDESLRVLIPGGLLICETPNPANVTIGACNFYLDPTHRHPLPAPLVRHLAELRGFGDVHVNELAANDAMRIDEDSETARRVNDFFYGPQNYAVIARKPGPSR